MNKFWIYFKKAIFVWGIISLAFFLFIIISLTPTIIPMITSHKSVEQEQDLAYDKTFDDIRLNIIHKTTDQTNNILISVTKSGTPLVSNYKLPIKEYNLDWIEITDATVIPVDENEYRIILYSAVYDCDQESYNYIWLLKLNKQMNIMHMIGVSDIHKIEGKEILIFGNKVINIPSSTNFKDKQFTVPIEIRIGETIKTAPMLNQKNIEMMKIYFEKEIQKRMDNLKGISDTSTIEQYKKASKEFNEAISEKVIPY